MTEVVRPVHQRVYLLAYDLDKNELYHRVRTAFLVRAGALTELALRGRLVDDGGDAKPVGSGSTGDPVLDAVLAETAEKDRKWHAWLRRQYKETLDAVERELAEQGVVTIREKKVLGLVNRTRVAIVDPDAVRHEQQRVAGVLRGSGPVSAVNPSDAAVVAIVAAGEAPTAVSRKERKDHAERIDQLVDRLGDIAPGLEKAVRGMHMTMVAAQGGMGGG